MSALPRGLADAWLDAGALPGTLRATEWLARRRPRSVILCYHGVQPRPTDEFCPNAAMDVTPEQFEAHVAYLVQHHEVVALDEIVRRRAGGVGAARPAVAITFDDAYANNVEHAAPILRRHGCPATIFVPVGHIDTGRAFWWVELESWLRTARHRVHLCGRPYDLSLPADRLELFDRLRVRLTRAGRAERARTLDEARAALAPDGPPVPSTTMTWAQIERLASEGLLSFGAHSVDHHGVSRLTDDELADDLTESWEQLARHVHRASTVFAYPYGRFGDFDPRAERLLRRLGLQGAVTLIGGCVEDAVSAFALPRVFVGASDDVERLRAKLAGVDALLWRARRLAARARGQYTS